MKPYVIGFMGYAGVGKTTAANIYKSVDTENIVINSFASPLKQAVQSLFLLSNEQIYGDYEQKTKVDERWGKSPRQLLQIIGTDCLREMIDRKFHVKRMAAWLQSCDKSVVIIDDIRFEDEAELVNRYGKCFNIRRPDFPKEDVRHASEYPPEHLASGYYIYNQGETLKEYTRQLLQPNNFILNLIQEKLNATR